MNPSTSLFLLFLLLPELEHQLDPLLVPIRLALALSRLDGRVLAHGRLEALVLLQLAQPVHLQAVHNLNEATMDGNLDGKLH